MYTDRLKLRSLHSDDWLNFLHVQQDPIINQFVREPDCKSVLRDKFEHRLSPWIFDSGDWLTLTIEEIGSNRFIGFTGLYCANFNLGHVEVGYMLSSAGQGQGYATESLAALIDWACLSVNVHKFIGICANENKASARVLEKVGFKLEGVFRHNVKIAERWIDDSIYGLLSEERSL